MLPSKKNVGDLKEWAWVHMGIRDGCLFGIVGLLIFIGGKINPSISLDGCNQLKLLGLLLKDGAWRR